MAHRLFLWFYCLSIPQALSAVLLATAAVLAADRVWHRRLWWRALLGVLLLGGIWIVLLQTLLGRAPGDFQPPVTELFASYAEVFAGGNREILRSNLMNVALFYPLGLCAALLIGRGRWRLPVLTLLLGALSFGIEYAQVRFGLGLGEADDLFHNTLGAFLGVLAGQQGPALLRQLPVWFRRLHR